MKRFTLEETALACGGKYIGDEALKSAEISSVERDSRQIKQNSLFLAIKGERVDGHDYIDAAISSGSGCVLCERIPKTQIDRKYVAVVVEDSIRAVGELAKAYDRRINHRKVAITGSVGKTTTKEFVAAVLGEAFRVHKTEGN
jgi:UDP-N-acetylmuramoyl-tripeptide--D-alanyl-D-alanine ligase